MLCFSIQRVVPNLAWQGYTAERRLRNGLASCSDHARIVPPLQLVSSPVSYAFRLRRLTQSGSPEVGTSNDCALVMAPCAFSRTAVTFRGRCRGNLVLRFFEVDFS